MQLFPRVAQPYLERKTNLPTAESKDAPISSFQVVGRGNGASYGDSPERHSAQGNRPLDKILANLIRIELANDPKEEAAIRHAHMTDYGAPWIKDSRNNEVVEMSALALLAEDPREDLGDEIILGWGYR